MATKSTGGIPRVGVEAWDPGIKSPGINKHNPAGAYALGTVATQVNWSTVNDSIQESIQQMGTDLGKMLKAKQDSETIDPETAAELGLDESVTWNRQEFIANAKLGTNDKPGMSGKDARKAWREHKGKVEGITIPADLDGNETERSEDVVEVADTTGEAQEDAFTAAVDNALAGKNFAQMSGKEKRVAVKRLNKLSESKKALNTIIEEWAGGDMRNINWDNYKQFPEVQSFIQHMLDGEFKSGVLPYEFSWDDGGTIKYGDGKTVKMSQLKAGQHIYSKSSNETVRENVEANTKIAYDLLRSAEDKIIKEHNVQGTDPTVPFTYDRATAIREYIDQEFSEAWLADVWSTQMSARFGNQGNEYITYDPQKHEDLVKKFLINEIDHKMGQQNILTQKVDPTNNNNNPVPTGKVRVAGLGDVDASLYQSMQKIAPTLANLSLHPEGDVYNKNNPLPESDVDWDSIRKGSKSTSKKLNKAMETLIGEDRSGARWSYNFKNQLNKVVAKWNSDPSSLSSQESDLIKAYKAHIGAFDETTDLSSLFDKKTKVTNPEFNRTDKIITLDLDGEEQTYDLKNAAEREEFFSLVVTKTGTNIDDANYILDFLLKQFNEGAGINFETFKPPLK